MLRTTVKDIKNEFAELFHLGQHINDKDGMLEILNASFICDEDVIFGKPNKAYMVAERDWYDSQSLDVNVLGDIYGKVPVIWKENAANTRGEINSNYGYLVYSPENGDQYEHVRRELKSNPSSRRATIVYTRPSIHVDYSRSGINDFICTNVVTYWIKSNKLVASVQMRSNDAVFGYINDLYWQQTVQRRLAQDLDVEVGKMLWQAQSLHIYPRHLHHVENYINTMDAYEMGVGG